MTRIFARVPVFFLALLSLAGTTRPDAIWLDVPFVKQEKEGCGAASISMVMQYWSRELDARISARADPRVIQQALFSKQAKGIFASAIKRYFEEAGFRAFAFKGAWTDLRNHLLEGRPLIVCLGGSRPTDRMHYVVVAGLDGQQNLIFVNDPARRKLLRLDRLSFEKDWRAAGNWTLLAVPQQHE